ncbi:NAD-dependent epimerase/dehydratase family protein [Frondihabitans sucicola]|uniref:NAD-dependent epimerase/dehydratase family protein n=1 Tax=Frondihabitans sucicola TaxID=1268041 RepID=UPI002573C016|nr:NAD-dependent epimerase/dehydratase family protein [Frondihabitans sucicola]
MTTNSNRAPRRVLVTGAAGEIGTAATAELVEHGIAVTALSLAGPFPPGADRIVVGDATSPTDVAEALDGVDGVVHLAAIPHPTLGTPLEVYRTNVTATFNVLSSAGALGVPRAVIASSINAFGVPMNAHGPMPAYFPLDEELPVDLEDAYSLSKHSDESTSRMAWRRWGSTSSRSGSRWSRTSRSCARRQPASAPTRLARCARGGATSTRAMPPEPSGSRSRRRSADPTSSE